MCANHQPTDPDPDQSFGPSYFTANLRQPGPLSWKLRRVWANLGVRLSQRQNCCGNAGEPGC
jgi:hypothetical protein